MLEARAVELLSDHPDYQLLTTIPGISPINALTILAEAGDLRRFRHHRQVLKFCGMDLATVQSGMFRGQSGISKYGDAQLRRTFWMAGQVAVLKRTNSVRENTTRGIDTTPMSAARPLPRSQQRWRAPFWVVDDNALVGYKENHVLETVVREPGVLGDMVVVAAALGSAHFSGFLGIALRVAGMRAAGPAACRPTCPYRP